MQSDEKNEDEKKKRKYMPTLRCVYICVHTRTMKKEEKLFEFEQRHLRSLSLSFLSYVLETRVDLHFLSRRKVSRRQHGNPAPASSRSWDARHFAASHFHGPVLSRTIF